MKSCRSSRMPWSAGVSAIALALPALIPSAATAAQTAPAADASQTTRQAADASASASRAAADAPAAAPQADTQEPGDIVVTGTRVLRNGYQAPTPTTIVSGETFRQAAQPTIADYVNTLPALSGSSTPRNTGPGIGGGIGGANLLNLRNLGVSRTLTLLDGRRVVGAATTGAVDVNLLPTALVSRVDVVTGGASAAWGSDAVAGVVDFVLDTKFTGLKGEVVSGITERGDGRQFRANLSGGLAFGGGRGNLIVSGEYVNNEGVDRASSRSWFNGAKIVNNPAYAAGNGQPRLLVARDVGLSVATDGGLITAGPLRGTQFLPGGTPAAFDFGSVSGSLKLGGTPNDIAGRSQLLAPLRYGTAFARVSYDVTDDISAFVEASYGETVSNYLSVPYFRFGNITIRNDNAFLDDATRARLAGAGAATFALGRTNFDFGDTLPRNERRLKRGVAGLSGKFGEGWSWDVYYQHGESTVHSEVANDPVVSRYNLATDAVRSATGAIVCRSTLTNPSNGCVPVNLFGFGSPSAAAKAYIVGTATQDITLKQDVAAATVRGDPLSLPAGPVSLAAGLEYRREAYRAGADAISQADDFWVGNYKPSAGSYDVKEVFGELVVPIVKSTGLLRSFDLNGAVRYTDYSTSGGVVTWKVGATAALTDNVRLRGTVSRDIRAPNLNDLFLGGQVNTQPIVDVNGANYFVLRRQTGNTALLPERSTTYSGGIVLTPTFLPGLNLSADYFRIRISDAIATLTVQQIVSGCAGGTTALCSYITRNAAGAVTQIVATGLNLASEQTSGVDFEASYRRRLSDLGVGSGSGAITLRGLASYVNDRVIELPGTRIDYAGEVGDYALPKWRGLATVNYDDQRTSVSFVGRYVGAGKLSNTLVEGVDIDDNTVPAIWYFDANATIKAGGDRRAEFFVAVENLFDTDPRIAPTITLAPQTSYGTNATLYDTLGRQFRVGFRFRL